MGRRIKILPAAGTLLVNTDLHGNLGDLNRMTEIFESARQKDRATHGVLLGSGPTDRGRITEAV